MNINIKIDSKIKRLNGSNSGSDILDTIMGYMNPFDAFKNKSDSFHLIKKCLSENGLEKYALYFKSNDYSIEEFIDLKNEDNFIHIINELKLSPKP